MATTHEPSEETTEIRFGKVHCLQIHEDMKSFTLTYKKPTFTDSNKQISIRAVVLDDGTINITCDDNSSYSAVEKDALKSHAESFLDNTADKFTTVTV